jgi:hypothetical protein
MAIEIISRLFDRFRDDRNSKVLSFRGAVVEKFNFSTEGDILEVYESKDGVLVLHKEAPRGRKSKLSKYSKNGQFLWNAETPAVEGASGFNWIFHVEPIEVHFSSSSLDLVCRVDAVTGRIGRIRYSA